VNAAVFKRAWQALTWKHWAWATSIALAVDVISRMQKFEVNLYWAVWRAIFNAPWLLFFAYVFLATILLAESSSPQNARTSWRRYLAAVLAASVVCLASAAAFSDLVAMPPEHQYQGKTVKMTGDPETSRKAYAVFGLGLAEGVFHGWFATFIYVYLRNGRIAARALSDAQLRRAEASRTLLATQLESTQVEIDPDDVLLTLDRIQESYDEDPAAGDIRMDHLIAILRAAIPRLRTEGSSLAASG
jgi:hypothetical protein